MFKKFFASLTIVLTIVTLSTSFSTNSYKGQFKIGEKQNMALTNNININAEDEDPYHG